MPAGTNAALGKAASFFMFPPPAGRGARGVGHRMNAVPHQHHRPAMDVMDAVDFMDKPSKGPHCESASHKVTLYS